MSEGNAPDHQNFMVLPAFGKSPELRIDLSKIREGDRRIPEAQHVTPITYAELSACFNESYRDLKRYLSSIGYLITQTEKAIEEIKADVLLGTYPEYLAANPKQKDATDVRKAFLSKDPKYEAALERLNQLKATESHYEGKLKVFERTCQYMNKKMDLILKSGMNTNMYVTSGKK